MQIFASLTVQSHDTGLNITTFIEDIPLCIVTQQLQLYIRQRSLLIRLLVH